MAGTSAFRIDITRAETRATLTIAGELDSATSPGVLDAFDRLAGEADELHLDLDAVSFIDSAGLRAIVHMEQTARQRGLALVMRPPPQALTEPLQVTGLTDRLTLAAHQASPSGFRPFVERVEFELPSEPDAPSRAREEIRQAAERLDRRSLDAAILLTSEIVTNAVVHPGCSEGYRIGLRITCFENGIRCEVSDPGEGFDPASLRPREPELGGRGLVLVDALSSRWGTVRHRLDGEERFCVWFELDADADADAGAGAGAGAEPGAGAGRSGAQRG